MITGVIITMTKFCEIGMLDGTRRIRRMDVLTQSQLDEIPIAVPFALACRGKISGT